jgi:hypothetical protein
MAKKPDLHIVGDPASTSVQPPRPLGIHGASLWNRVQSEYDIHDAGGAELLCLACEALDRVGRLREQIDHDGEVLRVRGAVRAHPGLRDELAGLAFVARVLTRLNLDVEPVRPGPGRPPKAGGW